MGHPETVSKRWPDSHIQNSGKTVESPPEISPEKHRKRHGKSMGNLWEISARFGSGIRHPEPIPFPSWIRPGSFQFFRIRTGSATATVSRF